MRDELLAWLRSKNPNLTQDPLDHDDLIEARLIDSLDFLEFIYLLEELSGEPVDVSTATVDDFRTLAVIERKFFKVEQGALS